MEHVSAPPTTPQDSTPAATLSTSVSSEAETPKERVTFAGAVKKKESHLSADLALKQSLRKLGTLGKDVSASSLTTLRAIAEQEEAERRREDQQNGSRKRELRRELRRALAALEKVDTRHGRGGEFILRLCGKSRLRSSRRILPEEATRMGEEAATLAAQEGGVVFACARGVGLVRQGAIRAVEHPSFDQFIMACILANCVMLAISDPTLDEETPTMALIGFIFLVIFTVEAVTQATALGHLYVHDAWNWLDVVVVAEGWISLLSQGDGYLAGLKTLRILRPLRVANRLPALKRVITAMLGSLPAIANSLIVLGLTLFLFGLLCSMLWSGTFSYRCMNDVTGEWVDEDTLCYPEAEVASSNFCESLTLLNQPYTCEVGESCKGYRGRGGDDDWYDGISGSPGEGTPESGSINFDNALYSFLTLFSVTTMEGWSDVLYWSQDAMAEWTFLIFLAIIVIGNFTVVNLMIAAILVQLDGATESNDAEKAKAKKEEKPLPKPALLGFNSGSSRSLSIIGDMASQESDEYKKKERSRHFRKHWPLLFWLKERTMHELVEAPLDFLAGLGKAMWLSCQWHCYGGFPRGYADDHWSSRARFFVLDEAAFFSNFIQACILMNLFALALDAHNISAERANALNVANLVFTVIFTFEMFAKLLVGGIPDYFLSWWNIFDGFIVTTSLVDLVYEYVVAGDGEGGSSLGALRIIRMLRLARVARIARLANKWKFLQDVLKLMVSGMQGMGPVLLLLMLFMFIFSILGMQMFGSIESIAEASGGYIRFDSFFCAFVQCFYVLTVENWVDVMYVAMAETGPISAIYFVALVVLGSFIMLNLILAVVLGGGGVSDIQFDAGLSQLDGITSSYQLRCGMARWQWYSDQKHKESLRHEAAHRLQKIVDRHEMRCVIHNWFYESEQFAEEAAERVKVDPENASAEDKRIVLAAEYAKHYRHTREEKRSKAAKARNCVAEIERANLEAAKERVRLGVGTSDDLKMVSDSKDRKTAEIAKEVDEANALKVPVDLEILAHSQCHSSPKGKAGLKKSRIGLARDIKSLENVYASLGFKINCWRRCWWTYRRYCCTLMAFEAWRNSIMAAIIISSVTMLAPDPPAAGLHAAPVFIVDMVCALLFVVEVFVLAGALEIPHHDEFDPLAPPQTGLMVYFSDPWNRLDFGVICASLLRLGFEPGSAAFRVLTLLRAHRPLRIINRIRTLRETVFLLYSACIHLGTLALFLAFAMTAYAVVGMQLLKGTFGDCDDGAWADDDAYMATVGSFPEGGSRWGKLATGSTIGDDALADFYVTRPCSGNFTFTQDLGDGQQLEARGEWVVSTFNFDDFPTALMSVFVLTIGGWGDIMFMGLSATDVDHSPKPYANQGNLLVVFYMFFGVAFFGLYYVNLFIGVVFERYTEMGSVKDDGHFVASENREWEGWQAHLKLVAPDVAIPRPTAHWRRTCFKISENPKLSNAVLFTIGLNAVTLVVAERGQSESFTNGLEYINCLFAAVFAVEAFLKLAGHGGKGYFSSSENCFDFVVTAVSALDSALFLGGICADTDSAAVRLMRSMRVFRLVRLIGRIEGCADILLACRYALSRLAIVCLLLLIIVFYFANIAKVLFVTFADHGSRYANFRSVFGAMQLLFVLMTGDAWNDTYEELLDDASSESDTFAVNIFFVVYMLINFFVTVNLFIMVVCEAFEVLSESNRRTVEKLVPTFKKEWSKYDPEASGRLCMQPPRDSENLISVRYGDGIEEGKSASDLKPQEALELFVRRVPAPLGVAMSNGQPSKSRTAEARVRSKVDFLIARPNFSYEFHEVLLGLVALWLTEEEQVKVPGIEEQIEHLAASVMIASRLQFIAKRIRARRLREVEAARAAFRENNPPPVKPAAPEVTPAAFLANAHEAVDIARPNPRQKLPPLQTKASPAGKSALAQPSPKSPPKSPPAALARTQVPPLTKHMSIAEQIKAGAAQKHAEQMSNYKKRLSVNKSFDSTDTSSTDGKVRLAPLSKTVYAMTALGSPGSSEGFDSSSRSITEDLPLEEPNSTSQGFDSSKAISGQLPLGGHSSTSQGTTQDTQEPAVAAPKHDFVL